MALTGTATGTFGPFRGSVSGFTRVMASGSLGTFKGQAVGRATPDSRQVSARKRLRRLIPPPAPESGWGYLRQRVEGQFVGVNQDDQSSTMERMLLLGARMARVGSNPTDWSIPETQWYMTPVVDFGAEDAWLDVWGGGLNVPRIVGEPDQHYAVRVLAEIANPHTTNQGMAAMIDTAIGVQGTVVLEAADYYVIPRYNEAGRRFNEGLRFSMAGELPNGMFWACFVVILPGTTPQSPWTLDQVTKVVERRHAAGTRLLRIHTLPGGWVNPHTFGNPDSVSASFALESASPTPSAYEVATPSAGGVEGTVVMGV